MSLHLDDFEDLPHFEKTRRRKRRNRRDLVVKHRNRSCTGKRRYHSEEQCKEVVAIRRNRDSGPLRIYHCALCNGYHLTRLMNDGS